VVLVAGVLAAPALAPRPALAEEDAVVSSQLPGVIFLVEMDRTMREEWQGNAELGTRWQVVIEAIADAVAAAPPGMPFAVVGTASYRGGWTPIASFDDSRQRLLWSLANTQLIRGESSGLAGAYASLLSTYLGKERRHRRGHRWWTSPFDSACTSIDVVVIGDAPGPRMNQQAPNCQFPGDVRRGRGGPERGFSLLDDVAYTAATTDLVARLEGVQTVRTHTIFLDPAPTGEELAERIYASAAEVGGGLYFRAEDPEDVSVALSTILSDTLHSALQVSSTFTLTTPYRLFRGWTEVGVTDDGAGTPLHRGHLEAFQLVADPDAEDYGAIAETPLWDAGALLAERIADPDARNSNVYREGNPSRDERTLWTNPAQGGTFRPRAMVALDNTSIGLLGDLLFEDYGADYRGDPGWGCPDYPPNDLNGDCIVDSVDAGLAVDFLRGVPDVDFGDQVDAVVESRGSWKLGGMYLSQPALAEARPRIISDDRAFVSFLGRIEELDPVVYLTANDGYLHAFKAPYLDSNGDGWEEPLTDVEGGWELWGFMPRHLLDHDSPYHQDTHRALGLMQGGERHLNDGSVNLTYAWMDGVPNLVDDDCREADADGLRDADGCDMHRVLVVSMGLGSRYHYAIDVSHPWEPRFLWEWVGDRDGWRKGLSTGTPVIAEVLDAETNAVVTVAIWTSGTADLELPEPDRRYRGHYWWYWYDRWRYGRHGKLRPSDHSPGARWYMTDLANPASSSFSPVGYKIDRDLSPYVIGNESDPRYEEADAAAGLFGTPAAVDYDEDGVIDALYMGSRHGYLYKVLLDNGDLSATAMERTGGEGGAATCLFKAPVIKRPRWSQDAGNQAVYYRPSVSRDSSGVIRVSWGTGWPGTMHESDQPGHVFIVADGEEPGDEWSCKPAVAAECGAAFDPMRLSPGEKLAGPVMTHAGLVLFTTYVADDACGVGETRIYAMSLDDCTGGYQASQDWGPEELPVTSSKFATIEGVPSRFSYSNDGIYLTVTGADGTVDSVGPVRPVPPEALGDRVALVSWRHAF